LGKQVRELAKEFDVCVSSSVYGFHEYVISGNCDNFPSGFQPLAAAVNTLIISTAECERSFSNMNTTISCVRCSILLKPAAALMFISLVGHPISEFNPENYVKEWLKKVITMQTTLLAQGLQKGHVKYPIVKTYEKISKCM
jgi:hypothetical protein